MAAFLRFKATDPNGKFNRETVINVDAISRIDTVGTNCCKLVMIENPSESVYVAGTLDDVIGRILEHSLPPHRAPGR